MAPTVCGPGCRSIPGPALCLPCRRRTGGSVPGGDPADFSEAVGIRCALTALGARSPVVPPLTASLVAPVAGLEQAWPVSRLFIALMRGDGGPSWQQVPNVRASPLNRTQHVAHDQDHDSGAGIATHSMQRLRACPETRMLRVPPMSLARREGPTTLPRRWAENLSRRSHARGRRQQVRRRAPRPDLRSSAVELLLSAA